MQRTLRLATAAAVALLTQTATADAPAAKPTPPASSRALSPGAFQSPPPDCRPWAYWWWLNANVTEATITRDLEGLARQGFGGVLLFDVTAYGHHLVPAPERTVPFMSPRWRELVRFALTEAERVGLTVSINLSTCGGSLRTPWELGEHAAKQLLWTSARVDGPAVVDVRLQPPPRPHVWPVAVLALRHEEALADPAADIETALGAPWREPSFAVPQHPPAVDSVDLTSRIHANNRLQWDVPPGHWTILRFVGATFADRTRDVDILSREAVETHFERMGGALIAAAGSRAGSTLTHFYNVSWEGVSPSWTPGFDTRFETLRGYPVRSYLPVLAGITVGDRERSQRALRDISRTLGDCFRLDCYQRFTELCHKSGLRWHSESGGPWSGSPLFRASDVLEFWGCNDMPQGEFWLPWPEDPRHQRTNARHAAMAAHTYGRRLVSIEAFTHMQRHWTMYPAAMKTAADAAFCDGINQVVWHTSSASPEAFGLPGIVYFAGTHINPNVTWWPFSRPFLMYLARCQYMLRQGRFVADVCVYASDRNHARWTRAHSWSPNATLSLPPGYTYDLLSTEVLTEHLAVAGGDLVLPDGMRYRLLVVDLDDGIVPPEALAKVRELARAGATVILGSRPPLRAPGMQDYPDRDRRVAELGAELWPADTRWNVAVRPFGRGRLLATDDLSHALENLALQPDFEGPFAYIHRRTQDADIYFVAGSGTAFCTFRAGGREPEIWDAKSGICRSVLRYQQTDDGRVRLPLRLLTNGSAFVVFRRAAAGTSIVAANGPARMDMLRPPGGAPTRAHLWSNGRYDLEDSRGNALTLNATGIPDPLPLTGPWHVTFDSPLDPGRDLVMASLQSWHTHPDPFVKHFAGTATYSIEFTLSAAQSDGLVRLDLGDLLCLARVRLNNATVGILWTPPWRIDLSEHTRAGPNQLDIDVVNTWHNRMVGEARLPPEQRRVNTNVALRNAPRVRRGPDRMQACQGFCADDPLMPAGLFGPVRLEFGQAQTLDLEP